MGIIGEEDKRKWDTLDKLIQPTMARLIEPLHLSCTPHLQECFSKSSLMASSDKNLSPSALNKAGHSPWSGLSSRVTLVEHSMGHRFGSSIVKHSCPCSHSSISRGSGLGRLEKESWRGAGWGTGCKGTLLNIAFLICCWETL